MNTFERLPHFLRLALLPLAAAAFGIVVLLLVSWCFDFSYLSPEAGFQPPNMVSNPSEHVTKDLTEMLRLDFLTNIFPSR